jgi:hypothetical protein
MTISQWKALQLVYGETLEVLEGFFEKMGYCFMPIKGAYLVRTGLAAGISNRKMVDIDLLIPEKQFDEVCKWFQTLPGVSSRENYWPFEKSFVYQSISFPVYLEFHRLVNFPARFLLPNEQLFNRAVHLSRSCLLPDPVDALLIHICHKLAHVIDGFEEQFYSEIRLYASQNGFDWEVFWKRAKTTGIYNFIWCVIDKCIKHTDLFLARPPAPSLYCKFLSMFDLFMYGSHPLIRRVFFEIPFTRDPLFLFKHKFRY